MTKDIGENVFILENQTIQHDVKDNVVIWFIGPIIEDNIYITC